MIKTFAPFKGRTLEKGQHIEVYFNLHKGVFSIRDMNTGFVVGHAPRVWMCHGSFIVSEAGRQRVLKSGRKNVHAFVRGYFEGFGPPDNIGGWNHFSYNPHDMKTFQDTLNKQDLIMAGQVYLFGKGGMYK